MSRQILQFRVAIEATDSGEQEDKTKEDNTSTCNQ